MSITPVSALHRLSSSRVVSSAVSPAQKKFSQIVEGLSKSPKLAELLGTGLRAELRALETSVFKGQQLSATQLLRYQIKLGEFNLRVELCSKLSEGLTSTIKRFQGGQ